MRRFILATLGLVPCLAQQAAPDDTASIAGTVLGEDGSAVAGSYVTLHLLLTPGPAMRQHFQTQWGAYSDKSGSFRFNGLRNGSYRLCVQAPATAWLDPCEWGLAIPSVALTDKQRSQTIAISLKQGVEVPIRIDDPGQVLVQNEGKTAGAHLLIGVRTAASTFRTAILTSQEGTARTLKVVIPFDKLIILSAASAFYKLADSNGTPFSKPGVAIPLLVPAGQTPATVRLSVAGGK